MTGRMVQSGVRPNKFTFRLEAQGHVKLGDPRSAMGSIKSLRTAAGTCVVCCVVVCMWAYVCMLHGEAVVMRARDV